MQVLDFLYERIPFSVFDNYLVKHLNLTQSEFGKFKQLALAVVKNSPPGDDEKPDNLKSSEKKPAKKKERPKEPPAKPKNQPGIMTFFKINNKAN